MLYILQPKNNFIDVKEINYLCNKHQDIKFVFFPRDFSRYLSSLNIYKTCLISI